MSWFQSLRDELTLRPFEAVHTHSESSAMASGPPDVMANQEAAEAAEECSGKKKSKFQTFKKFFARKKRKEPSSSGADAALKGSQSTDNISKTSENNTLTQSEKDKGSGSKISLGSKALSHDSVFVSDSSEANEALGASQDSIHGKVKSLQLQLKQAIRLGSPPSLMCVKRTEDMGTMSEDDGLPCSPPEYTGHTALAQGLGNSSISLEGTDSDEEQLSCAASSRAVSPLVVVPGDFSQPASPFACLDNSAAKHKLGLRHKACNKRKPATRLELKPEEDSVVEDVLNSSISEAVEENNEQKVKDASVVEFEPKEEEEEKEQAEHSRQSLLSDKEEREESSSEPEAEQDVSDGPDTSCPPGTGLSEEEPADARPSASSETGSGASSVDSPRGTPEPLGGQREYLMDPPGTAYGTGEKGDHGDHGDHGDAALGLTGGEDGEKETEEEEESSLLQEVLSSLKNPLNSPLAETESIFLEMEQEEVKNREEEENKAETGEEEEVKEEEEEPAVYQAVVSGSSTSDQNTKEEEEEVTTATVSYNDAKEEMEHVEEEEEEDSTEEEEEEEEELVVEHFRQYDQVEEVEQENVEKIETEEENGLHVTQTDNQMEEEGEEKKMEEEEEVKEEAKELEQESEAKREEQEKTAEDDKDDEVEMEEENEEVEEPEEAKEDEKEDVQEKMFSEEDGGEMVVDPEEADDDDVNVVKKDETEFEKDGDEIFQGQEEGVFDKVHESQKTLDQMEPKEQNLDQEKDTAATEPNVEETRGEQDEEQESIKVFPQETKQEKEQSDVDTAASSRPSSLTLPETPTTPSKTSTIHINLVSPSAEKSASCFQLPPSTVEAKESMSTAEEPEDKVEKAEEESKQPCDSPTAIDKEAKLSASMDETSKVRFTITPAWQRSLSIGEKERSTLPSSPPASLSSSSATGGTEVVTTEEPLEKAESASSAKVEVVLSPSRAKNAEMTTTKPQWNTSPTPESSAVEEGNSNNPFGVRLRKTSGLHRFSSEEENAEPVHESASQPSSCSADSPQPLSVKPSGSQPISNKPALPKKPEVTGDGGGRTKRILDPAAARGGSDPPSWISVAKQKQKIYKENSLDNTAVQKEEQERRSSVPKNSSSNKTPESSSKVSPSELNKSSASAEKESRRSLSPPTPVPPQLAKSPSLPFPVPPKPHVTTSTTPKPSPQISLSPPTPVPVAQRPPSCMSPPSTSKPASSLPTGNVTLTSPPFSPSRTTPAQSAGSSPTPGAQRGVPSPVLTQDEPPWMALAKKKAKAWSEMPQIVQ